MSGHPQIGCSACELRASATQLQMKTESVQEPFAMLENSSQGKILPGACHWVSEISPKLMVHAGP